MLKIESIITGVCIVCLAMSQTHAFIRGHGAHVHGLADLSIVLDGDLLRIVLDSPAYNFFGFEHLAVDEADVNILSEARKTLQRPERLFIMNAEAKCAPGKHHLESDQIEALSFPKQPEALSHSHGEAHARDQHPPDHHRHRPAPHQDIRLNVDFHCNEPKKLQSIGVELFDYFDRIEKIEAKIVMRRSQYGQTLDAKNSTIDLKP